MLKIETKKEHVNVEGNGTQCELLAELSFSVYETIKQLSGEDKVSAEKMMSVLIIEVMSMIDDEKIEEEKLQ